MMKVACMLGYHIFRPFSDNPFRCIHCNYAPDPEETLATRRAVITHMRSEGLIGSAPIKDEYRW